MPKIVDHDQRRVELVSATWRIIARDGIEGATMREIAAEAGFSNGALKPYFSSKEDLLTFAFAHVFRETNQRIAIATEGKSGLAALRVFCHEVLPLDDEKVSEARIVISFWQRALNHPDKAALHGQSMAQWSRSILEYLTIARTRGEAGTSIADEDFVGLLMNMLLGAQISAALSPAGCSPPQLISQLDGLLGLIREPTSDITLVSP
ncbi:TetR/AcrR family transcriptional regulator [Pseudarthrobacter sp. S9]|uniref:TetR/AcrR family transcriptional regulator n=1 Tax=Pseudarthrobacter sp. S9 TaxID=3418421 RepID=UPI003D00D1D8